LWLLKARTADGTFHRYAGKLNFVMGRILHQGLGSAIRITLISLAVAAERVRVLAEKGEIEVDDLPPVPPTLAKVN
jgi:hypothetical protein